MAYQYDVSGGSGGFQPFDPNQWGKDNPTPYTGALGDSYLAGELAPIQQGEMEQEGMAWNEGDTGGIIGKFGTAGKIAAARSNADVAKSSIIGRFNMMKANAENQRSMALEGQQFGASEAEKSRMFQDYLGRIQRDWQDKQRVNTARQADQSGMQGNQIGMIEGGVISAGAIAAAPFTGGTSLMALPAGLSMMNSSGKGGGGGGGGGGYGGYSGGYGGGGGGDPGGGGPMGSGSLDLNSPYGTSSGGYYDQAFKTPGSPMFDYGGGPPSSLMSGWGQ